MTQLSMFFIAIPFLALIVGMLLLLTSREDWKKRSLYAEDRVKQLGQELHARPYRTRIIANAWPEVVRRMEKALATYNIDPADSDYQLGYQAALEEMLKEARHEIS